MQNRLEKKKKQCYTRRKNHFVGPIFRERFDTVFAMKNDKDNARQNWRHPLLHGLTIAVVGTIMLSIFWDGRQGRSQAMLQNRREQLAEALRVRHLNLAGALIALRGEESNRQAFFADLRKPGEYAHSHIQDAIPVFADDAQSALCPDFLAALEGDRLPIYYDAMGGFPVQKLIKLLPEDRAKRIYFYTGGLAEWRATGMPLDGQEEAK